MGMSKQRIFNRVYKHLLTQKERAYDEKYGACSYLDSEGRKCAVGCLIPDGHPGQKFRGGVEMLFWKYPDIKKKLGNEVFLSTLQDIHDDHTSTPAKWKSELETLAEEEGLTCPDV
jgi:hypothetical protein